ncbi:MAG: transporter ATP-binding protein [Proteobacteria bacterium]|nr:transporter ATP-binding protein [Pseudomonadota bacterium]
MTAALSFTAVNKTFHSRRKTVEALRDVSFEVSEGEVFGFIGPNGAGKSTTIKVMLDIISNYEGEVQLYGVSAREARARQGVAYVPETPALYDQFTPLEILQMGLAMYGVRRNDADSWCKEWLERFSIGHVADRRIRLLSKGTVQRVALAHAMVVSPKLLVLDEPLSGLDPVGRKDVVEILTEYKRQGGAIFLTSHVLHDVERIADRFGFIHQGRLITTRSPRDLVSERADQFIVRYQASAGFSATGDAIREGEYEHELSQVELPAFVSRLNEAGCRILTVKPAISLETVFFKILESGNAMGEQLITHRQ